MAINLPRPQRTLNVSMATNVPGESAKYKGAGAIASVIGKIGEQQSDIQTRIEAKQFQLEVSNYGVENGLASNSRMNEELHTLATRRQTDGFMPTEVKEADGSISNYFTTNESGKKVRMTYGQAVEQAWTEERQRGIDEAPTVEHADAYKSKVDMTYRTQVLGAQNDTNMLKAEYSKEVETKVSGYLNHSAASEAKLGDVKIHLRHLKEANTTTLNKVGAGVLNQKAAQNIIKNRNASFLKSWHSSQLRHVDNYRAAGNELKVTETLQQMSNLYRDFYLEVDPSGNKFISEEDLEKQLLASRSEAINEAVYQYEGSDPVLAQTMTNIGNTLKDGGELDFSKSNMAEARTLAEKARKEGGIKTVADTTIYASMFADSLTYNELNKLIDDTERAKAKVQITRYGDIVEEQRSLVSSLQQGKEVDTATVVNQVVAINAMKLPEEEKLENLAELTIASAFNKFTKDFMAMTPAERKVSSTELSTFIESEYKNIHDEYVSKRPVDKAGNYVPDYATEVKTSEIASHEIVADYKRKSDLVADNASKLWNKIPAEMATRFDSNVAAKQKQLLDALKNPAIPLPDKRRATDALMEAQTIAYRKQEVPKKNWRYVSTKAMNMFADAFRLPPGANFDGKQQSEAIANIKYMYGNKAPAVFSEILTTKGVLPKGYESTIGALMYVDNNMAEIAKAKSKEAVQAVALLQKDTEGSARIEAGLKELSDETRSLASIFTNADNTVAGLGQSTSLTRSAQDYMKYLLAKDPSLSGSDAAGIAFKTVMGDNYALIDEGKDRRISIPANAIALAGIEGKTLERLKTNVEDFLDGADRKISEFIDLDTFKADYIKNAGISIDKARIKELAIDDVEEFATWRTTDDQTGVALMFRAGGKGDWVPLLSHGGHPVVFSWNTIATSPFATVKGIGKKGQTTKQAEKKVYKQRGK